jgi:hypothetical protein
MDDHDPETDSYERSLRRKRRWLGWVELTLSVAAAVALYALHAHLQDPKVRPLVDARIIYGTGGVAAVAFFVAGLRSLFGRSHS